jgi:hypothetical protein
MLRMYAVWIEGATGTDIQAIRNAIDGLPKVSLPPFAVASPQDNARQIVLRPLESPDSASSSASSPEGKKLMVEKAQKKVAERVGFEPTCRNYPTIRFRVGAVMTTSVPLRLT